MEKRCVTCGAVITTYRQSERGPMCFQCYVRRPGAIQGRSPRVVDFAHYRARREIREYRGR